MPFLLEHVLVSRTLDVVQHDTPQGFFFTVAAHGSFLVLHPGRLQRDASASVRHSMRIDTPNTQPPSPPGGIDGLPGGGLGNHPLPNPVPQPLHNGVQVTVEGIALTLRVLDPNGQLFTANEITLADLKKFRNTRGSSRPWSFTLSGSSRTYRPVAALNETVTDPKGSLLLGLTETVASSSAAPLVPRTRLSLAPFRTTFDLNRVGDFVANVVNGTLSFGNWRGTMRLLDPNGAEFARSGQGHLRCPIPLSALGRSRDATGNPRPWTLEVNRDPSSNVTGQSFITATVLGQGRINTGILQARIQRIFGRDGTFLKFKGRNLGERAQCLLTISDVGAAETIDMHDLLDSRLKAQGLPTDVQPDVPMVIFDRESDLGHGARVDVSALQTTAITVTIGPAQHLGANTPALRISVGVTGKVKVTGQGLTLATAGPTGGRVQIEVGLKIDPDGTPRMTSWVPDKPFDIDFSTGAIAAWIGIVTAASAGGGGLAGGPAGAIGGAIGGLIGGSLSVAAVEQAVENYVNDGFRDGVKDLFDDPTLAPTILMTLLGAHMSYLPVRFDGSDILFEHVAPLEPDPKPRANYAGAIGRTLREEAVGHTGFIPASLGNTWAADNLKSKIDHVVVVMMENRSYDHVLGYRSLAPADPRDAADGWTPELVAAVNARAELFRPPPPTQPGVHADSNPPVGPMRTSAFPLNNLNLRTRLPKGVGHELSDVTEQLAARIAGPQGRQINDPSGFINNFRTHKLHNNPYGEDLVVPFDVLRYYETNARITDDNTHKPVDDLPTYAFLADHFSYCDRYYCSHPGPTLPNRMYSLTGDVQHDRYGFPILDNNDGDNFLLSRAQTIYDVLTRHGVSWRVYESVPSVTMLRMFARYAGDDLNIRPIDELERDFAAGQVPSLVVIEPAMHHHPEDDDHPDADMYRGQKFIDRVYRAVSSNPAVWKKTMLVITYDEHGGLYDHVIPPIADVFEAPRPTVVSGAVLSGSVVGGLSSTPPRDGGVLGNFQIPPNLAGVLLGETLETVAPDVTVKVQYGVRVPTFVVSPWVSPGKGPSITLDHCSILKTILARFCGDTKPFLNDRVHASLSFESFLGEAQPRQVGPPPVLGTLPETARAVVSGASAIVTPPLFRKRMRSERVDYHDISGRLARMLGR